MEDKIIDYIKKQNYEYMRGYMDAMEDLLDISPACEKITKDKIRDWHDKIVDLQNEL